MTRTRNLLFAFLLISSLCYAQEELPTISADRPGYTWGAEVMQLHKLSWENGFGFESSPFDGQTLTVNSTIVRYGIFENVELRVGTDFMLFKEFGEGQFSSVYTNPLAIGTKLKIFEGTGILPSIGLLAELKSPHIGSKELLPSHIAPSLYALFEHTITDWFWVCYNAGLEWDGESAAPKTFLALGLGFNITESLGAFIETYNYLHEEEDNMHLTEFGLTWLVTRRLQLDLECDLDFRNFGKHYAIGCGVAWLVN